MVRVSAEWLAEALTGQLKPYITNLPKDLRIVDVIRVSWEDGKYRNTFDILVDSKEYSAVPECEPIPWVNVICKDKIEMSAEEADRVSEVF